MIPTLQPSAPWHTSLSIKVVGGVLVAALIGLALFTGLTAWLLSGIIRQEALGRGLEQARRVAAEIERDLAADHGPAPAKRLVEWRHRWGDPSLLGVIGVRAGDGTWIVPLPPEQGPTQHITVALQAGAGERWTLDLQISDSALAPIVDQVVINSLIVGLTVLVAFMAMIFFLSRWLLARPLGRLAGTVQALTAGRTDLHVPLTHRRDEFGALGRSVVFFRQKLLEIEQLRQRQDHAAQQAAQDRRAALIATAGTFEQDVRGVVEQVTQAATGLQGAAADMTALAQTSLDHAKEAMVANGRAATQVVTMAGAAEQLAQAIDTISQRIDAGNRVASDAVAAVDRTGQTVESLAEAADQVRGIVQLIADVAAQTNLLALNATIEAARAGEAGKGFAVVAGEVKNLASQTAHATQEIGRQIAAMHQATRDAVDAMALVRGVINDLNDLSTANAAAMSEQTDATRTISLNARDAARSMDQVSGAIDTMTRAADRTGHAAGDVRGAAADLSARADQMTQAMDGFLGHLRAG